MGCEERAELRGQVLDGRYRVGAPLGVGGTGVVFEARRLGDQTPLVVKTLRPLYAYNGDLVRRLRREAEVARRVRNAGLAPLVDEGLLSDGSPYIVMGRVWGESMARLIRRHGTLGVAETAAITLRAAAVLHAVHRWGYVHRDLKPEHIVLDRSPSGELQVHLLDFGVCTADGIPRPEREQERGRVFGTPSYASPEQASGDPDVDARTDVYGLGVCMFEALSGRTPFDGPDVMTLLRRIIRQDAPPLSALAPHVDAAVEQVVARALARAREGRFANMRALARALGPLVGSRQETERRLAATLWSAQDPLEASPTVRDAAA